VSKDSAVALEQLSLCEAAGAEFRSEVTPPSLTAPVHTQLSANETIVSVRDRAAANVYEIAADFTRVQSEVMAVGQLHVDVADLKERSMTKSLIVRDLRRCFESVARTPSIRCGGAAPKVPGQGRQQPGELSFPIIHICLDPFIGLSAAIASVKERSPYFTTFTRSSV
jgi:hypothetical protein